MNDDPAKARFFVIQALRLSGVVLVLVGLAIVNGAIALPEIVGYVLVAAGIGDAFIAPVLLARRWKTPPP
jgi:hypothetical protein